MVEDSREEARIAKGSLENEREKVARMEAEMAENYNTLVLFELASKIISGMWTS
jgi:hypothetical protein